MKRRLLLTFLVFALSLLTVFLFVSCGGGEGTTPSGNGPQKLNAPVVTLNGNIASWTADANADKFEISLDGTLSYVENTITSKALTNGQTIKVRAVDDGVSFATSDWSNTVTLSSGGTTDSSNHGGNTDSSIPGGSTDSSVLGGSTDSSVPGGSTDSSVPGDSTDSSVPGGSTDSSNPGAGGTDTPDPKPNPDPTNAPKYLGIICNCR